MKGRGDYAGRKEKDKRARHKSNGEEIMCDEKEGKTREIKEKREELEKERDYVWWKERRTNR